MIECHKAEAIFSDNMIFIRNSDRYLGEFNRVLKPGGLLAINCTTPDNVNSYWWMNGNAYKKQVSYMPAADTIVEMLKGAGFRGEKIKHFIDAKPCLGEQHLEYERCFDENYRKADSGWALMSDEELAGFLEKMKEVLGDKEMRKQFDEKQRNILNKFGSTTEIFARK